MQPPVEHEAHPAPGRIHEQAEEETASGVQGHCPSDMLLVGIRFAILSLKPALGHATIGDALNCAFFNWRTLGEHHMAAQQEVPRKTLSLGSYVRSDGQKFEIKVLIYELTTGQFHWLAIYDARHDEWGPHRLTLFIPNSLADTLLLAERVVKTGALEHVKTCLNSADRNGVDVTLSNSPDGWMLVAA